MTSDPNPRRLKNAWRRRIQDVLFVSSIRLDVVIAVHKKAPSGTRDVTVTNPDGQTGTKAACFTVN